MKHLNKYLLSFVLVGSISAFAQDTAEGEATTIQGLLQLVQEGRTSEQTVNTKREADFRVDKNKQAAKLAAEITITGPITLGNICLKIILNDLYANAFPASTYSNSLITSTCPLTIRATSTHMVNPTATNTCQKPLPKAKVIAITISKVGIDHITLTNHMTTSSVLPLK